MSEHDKAYAAVDLGASSGRVMAGRVGPDTLDLTETHRFPDEPVRLPEGLRWNIAGLYAGVLEECMRAWDAHDVPLLHGAAQVPALRSVVEASDPGFLAPGRMPERIAGN